MLNYLKFRLLALPGLRFDCDCACAAAPDLSGLANASKESAEIMGKLGQNQLDEAKRQYDQNMQVAKPVIDAQTALMNQTKQQGDDYFNYMKESQRPVEQALNAEAMKDNSAAESAERNNITGLANATAAQAGTDAQAIMARQNANQAANDRERALITGSNQDVYNARKADIDQLIGQANADVQQNQSAQTAALNRNMASMGINPNSGKFASANRQAALQGALAGAGAMNSARNTGIDKARALIGQNYDMRNNENANMVNAMTTNRQMGIDQGQMGLQAAQNARSMRQQDTSTAWAKKMDTAGLYRNLAGASQGAYGLANQSGNNAVQNSIAPGNQLLTGMAQGAQTTGQGLNTQVQGLGAVANAQTSYANGVNQAMAAGSGSGMSGLGSLMGGAAAMGLKFSDRRLKEDVEWVGKDENTGLNIYEFKYIGDESGKRYQGVMAQEVEIDYPDAVVYDDLGFGAVNYSMLGMQMVEV